MKYLPREIEPALKRALRQFPAVAVCGPRQSGKSTLLKEALGKKYKYITFDNLSIRDRCKNDPELFLKEAGEYIILDEIQYVPELLSYLKIVIDEKRQNNGRFVITGSQQFQLIKNIGDTLAGRIRIFSLLPFSQTEKPAKQSLKEPSKIYLDACLSGSYPELVIKPRLDREGWYSSYIQTYLERDVRGIYGVGNLLDFQKFMRLLAGRCSQILNLTDLSNELGVSINTIKNWLSILVACQIIYLLPPYFKNFGKRVVKNPKIYFSDSGLVAHLVNLKNKELILYSSLSGALFENYIVQETLKCAYSIGRLPELYYYRTHKGLEVDLLIAFNGKFVPFEIKMNANPKIAMAENIEKLRKISNDINHKSGGIICLSNETYKIKPSLSVYSLNAYLETAKKLLK